MKCDFNTEIIFKYYPCTYKTTGLPWIWISMEISMDGFRVFVISMDIVDIHFKIEL